MRDTRTAELEGRTAVVTGANTGIGKVTARELARRGARVIMACRSEDKALPVLEEIKHQTGNQAVEFLRLDLADLSQVEEAAAEVLRRAPEIHLLINNAGLAGQRGVTSDGFELAFGVNHLGHFLFTTLLLDRLRASAPARIVNVASKSHYRAKGIDWDAVKQRTKSVTGMPEYEVSKLANVLFTAELARRLESTGVSTYSLHPGVIASDVWRRVPWPVRKLMTAFMKSPQEGARTTIYCATETTLDDESGSYYDDCERTEPSRVSKDEALAAELWRRSEAWCAEAGS